MPVVVALAEMHFRNIRWPGYGALHGFFLSALCAACLLIYGTADLLLRAGHVQSNYQIPLLLLSDASPAGSKPASVTLPIRHIKSFSLALDVLALDDFMDNILQTSRLQGFRLELQNPENLHLIFADQDILLSSSFTLKVWHHLNVELTDAGQFSVDVDKSRVFSRPRKDIPDAAFAFDDFAVGTGLSRQRPLQGSIKNFQFDAVYVSNSRTETIVRFASLFVACLSAVLLLWPRPALYPPASRLHRWLPPVLVAIPLLVYQLAYFRAYFPISEGWFSEYGRLINQGMIPYKDFHLLVPPLYPYLVAGVQLVIGDSIFALRSLGVALMISMGLALYFALRVGFGAYVSAIAAILATIYYQRGNAFINYDYTQVVSFFLLLAAVFVCQYATSLYDAGQHRSRQLLYAFLFGVSLSLAVLTKHSNGGLCAVILGVGTLLVAFRAGPWRLRLIDSMQATLGFAIPLVILIAYLAGRNALPNFIEDVFLSASTAKGGVLAILTNAPRSLFLALTPGVIVDAVLRFSTMIFFSWLAAVVILAIDIAIHRHASGFSCRISQFYTSTPRLQLGLAAAALLTATIVSAQFYWCSSCFSIFNIDALSLNDAILLPILLATFGAVISLFVYYLFPSATRALWVVYSFFGIGLIWGNGTSAGFSEVGTFFGVSLLVAAMLTCGSRFIIPSMIPLAFVISAVYFLVNAKLMRPYSWWGIVTPSAREADCGHPSGILAGLCIPQPTLAKIERIKEAIQSNSRIDDPIYVYPHIPIFYLLSDRSPYLNAVVSWPDFMSDKAADDLSIKLIDSTPRVIVVAELLPDTLTVHEKLFRAGNALPQRGILAAIETLKSRSQILPILHIEELDGLAISVFVKAAP